MRQLLLMIPMALLLLLFSGCCEKETVYIKRPCPKFQNFYSEFNSSVWENNLTVEVEIYDTEE